VIVDTSAVLAILFREQAAHRLAEVLEAAPWRAIGVATAVEAGIVLSGRLGVLGRTLLSRFLVEARLELVPLEEPDWGRAVDAFLRYGKGRHPAGLNFGDCLTYAIAQRTAAPLLCIGNDFPRTDLPLVEVGGLT
jgi:ribonuclease VapC